ncbi:predicted protein [Botrytis cinerea T4]|uniref:Uncharacterized protein n=1 Tax=Botryotinia fuckeliana (strain T4) TaxID=999810 RepID=G2YQT2_BOTF4|nr:predicted protein [Botrytis cinerea T4]
MNDRTRTKAVFEDFDVGCMKEYYESLMLSDIKWSSSTLTWFEAL